VRWPNGKEAPLELSTQTAPGLDPVKATVAQRRDRRDLAEGDQTITIDGPSALCRRRTPLLL